MRLLILTQKVDTQDPILGFFHRWIEEFAQHCESVIVVCLYEGTHQLPNNVRVLSLGKEGGSSRSKYLWRFYTYIWRERKNYDAVYVHMNQIYVILGALAWRVLGKKISWWYAHGSVSFSMRVAEKCANLIFTSTPKGFRILSPKVHIVGQGIDTELFKPIERTGGTDSFVIVSTGRIGPVKHLDVLIRALKIVLGTNPKAELYLYGSPQTVSEQAYQRTLEDLVEKENLSGKVHFPGAIVYTDLPRVLANAGVFAQASQTGSLDKAVLEALAMNIPAVSTNEAFRNIPGVIFVEQTPGDVARGVQGAPEKSSTSRYIDQHHSLQALIQHKIRALKTLVQ